MELEDALFLLLFLVSFLFFFTLAFLLVPFVAVATFRGLFELDAGTFSAPDALAEGLAIRVARARDAAVRVAVASY